MKKVIILLMIGLALTIFCTMVSAKEELKFDATNVYWDGPYRLAVQGNFINTGTKIITGVSYLYLGVYYFSYGDYQPLTQRTWINDPQLLSIVLKPGQQSSWTFYFNTDFHPSFTYWVVDWKLEYNYLK